MAVRGDPNVAAEGLYSAEVLSFPIQVRNFFYIQETYKRYCKCRIYIYIRLVGPKYNNLIQDILYNQ